MDPYKPPQEMLPPEPPPQDPEWMGWLAEVLFGIAISFGILVVLGLVLGLLLMFGSA